MDHCRAAWLVNAVAILLLVVAPVRSFADPATDQAKIHNATAKRLFSLGLFREAAEEYERAYRLKSLPDFLFNLAQCYKRLTTADNIKRAIFYYRSFLNNAPDTPMRPEVEQEIARLERQYWALNKPAPPFYKRWWFWTVVGVAVAGATVGTVLALQPDDMKPVYGNAGYFDVPP